MRHIQRGRSADGPRLLRMLEERHRADAERVLAGLRPLLLDDRSGQVWMIRTDLDPAAGYAVLTWQLGPEPGGRRCTLEDLYVRRPGEGLGTLALTEVMTAAVTAGAGSMQLRTGPDQTRARAFFARLGFTDQGDERMARTLPGLADRAGRFDRARALAGTMADGLARLEPRISTPSSAGGTGSTTTVSAEQTCAAVAGTWPEVVARAADNALSLDPADVSWLNARLRAHAGLPDHEAFDDGEPPSTWSSINDLVHDDDSWEAVHDWGWAVLAQLTWGGHVPGLPLSTGWLLVSGLRVQAGAEPHAPDPDLDDAFLTALGDAGPDLWDAETLRALLSRHHP
jgi:hypothetical protein